MASITLPLNEVSRLTKGNLGLDDYPIFEGAPEGFREALNEKITRHFWTREIGMESIEMWRFHMRQKMWEIMPYYNKLYASELIKIEPLSTVNIENTSDTAAKQKTLGKESTTSESKNESASRSVNSDFPQTQLEGDADYATAGADSSSTAASLAGAKGTSENDSDSSEKGKSTTKGYSGAASALLNAYRQTFLNIDMMVIGDLNIMFLFVYDPGTPYSY